MAAELDFYQFQDPDADLVRRCQEGGPAGEQSFETLMARHAWRIQRRAARILGSESDAEDVVQEVFTNVHRFIHRYQPDRPFRHWLSVVTLNACRLELRRRAGRERRHEALRRDPATRTCDEIGLDPILRSWLCEAIGELPATTRDCIVARVLEGRPYREIAQRTNLSEPAVKMRVARGLRDLRSRYGLSGGVRALRAHEGGDSAAIHAA